MARSDMLARRAIEEAVDTQREAIGWGMMEVRVFKRGDESQRAMVEERAAS